YDRANKALGINISDIMFEGPADTLTATENAQPALLLSSYAAHQLLADAGVKPVMAVGHSLGEYSALTVADVFSLEDALPLVATRGRLMEAALPKRQGTMAAVLGLDAA